MSEPNFIVVRQIQGDTLSESVTPFPQIGMAQAHAETEAVECAGDTILIFQLVRRVTARRKHEFQIEEVSAATTGGGGR